MSVSESAEAAREWPWKKIGLAVGIAAAIGFAFWQFGEYFSLQALAEREADVIAWARSSTPLVIAMTFLVYVAVTALSLPAAGAMTIGIGWLFAQLFGYVPGLIGAVVLVNLASTTGATLAFLASRFLLRDSIEDRFGEYLQTFNNALEREGAFYLFTLRLVFTIPFVIINVVMGLTPMKTRTFWWVSQLGMLPATVIFANAGCTVPSLSELVGEDGSVSQILTWELAGSFALLGLFPLLVKKGMQWFRSKPLPSDPVDD